MEDNLLLTESPEGYIKQRKRSVQILFCLIYIVCLLLVVAKYQLIKISGAVGSLVAIFLLLTNFAVMLYLNFSKRIFLKEFTKKQKFQTIMKFMFSQKKI